MTEDKKEKVVDESDKELIRVARGDVDEDKVPQRIAAHKAKKRSTEIGNMPRMLRYCSVYLYMLLRQGVVQR